MANNEGQNPTVEHSSFRQNFQTWVDANYGENSRTKTITRAKYSKICRYLMGEQVETDAKFRFWVKSKAFRIVRHDFEPSIGVLCVPVRLNGRRQNSLGGYEHNHRSKRDVLGYIDYRQVAVVEDFYSIIRSVHINERGVHVGQKKTYRAVSGTYAFLPREAVSYFLMSCNHCKLRIQRSNSILVKHGIPPEYFDSDQEDLTDGEGSSSSNEKDLDGDYGKGPVRKRVKKEKMDLVHENGMELNERYDSSPSESELGTHGDPEYLPNGKASNGKTDSNGNKSLLNTAKMYAVQGDKETAKKFQHSGLQFCVRNNSRPRRGSGGGRRLSYSPDTDKRLLQWVMDRDKNGLTVSREAIQTQALALIREECPDFKASSGWVEKFLIRHKLCLPTKANMLENGVAKKGLPPPVPNGTDGALCPPPSAVAPVVEKNGEVEKAEAGGKAEASENGKKGLNLMDIPINRRGPARKRIVREFKDDEDDDEDCDPDDPDGDLDKAVPENVNPERLKAFNMFVRLFVDENLDRLVPISKQPKDKVLAIIHACQRQFPEFRDRARKRIRTYLKSCRRLKKLKEPLKRTADQINTVPSMSSAQMQEVNNILASACANEADLDDGQNSALAAQPAVEPAPSRPPLTNGRVTSPAETGGRTSTSTMTSSDTPPPMRNVSPVQRLTSLGAAVGTESLAAARAKVGAQYQLTNTEVTAIRQLIASYRESAAFLYRSADELEALLPASTQPTQKAVR